MFTDFWTKQRTLLKVYSMLLSLGSIRRIAQWFPKRFADVKRCYERICSHGPDNT